MSRSETIRSIPERFRPLTIVKRGKQTTRLPHKFADTNAALARRSRQEGSAGE